MGKTLLWKANQLLLIHVFHLRSVFECVMIYEVYLNWIHCVNMPVLLFITQIGGLFVVTFILTPYWTYKKTAQLFDPVDWSNTSENDKKATKKN